MSTTVTIFREFLSRLAENRLLDHDWETFAVNQHADRLIESLRQRLVRQGGTFDLWEHDAVPVGLQFYARVLMEELDQRAPRFYYRPEFHAFTEDGSLEVRCSMWEDGEHSCGYVIIERDAEDYAFWCWLVADPELRRGVKNELKIDQLQDQYYTSSLLNKP